MKLKDFNEQEQDCILSIQKDWECDIEYAIDDYRIIDSLYWFVNIKFENWTDEKKDNLVWKVYESDEFFIVDLLKDCDENCNKYMEAHWLAEDGFIISSYGMAVKVPGDFLDDFIFDDMINGGMNDN